jgi:hypothetical protein
MTPRQKQKREQALEQHATDKELQAMALAVLMTSDIEESTKPESLTLYLDIQRMLSGIARHSNKHIADTAKRIVCKAEDAYNQTK